ncbi:NUDIX hydrolase [Photobacterium rosenbergii]|uniref:NUDIX domain-containing protein n=1 Tax=Photobacterium rosenbergii TaxID=294936 RepID=A0ABU3ZBK7_9GAMM|nr:NUDIX domain-containing protein [Photobacterium rosenbergii]MDV5167491.1 NUDIX domain-containing protein [Photobacterium rosenbergii]
MELKTNLVSGVVLSIHNSQVMMLMLKRNYDEYWCNVAGKIEPGEKAPQAFLRELSEETQLYASELYNADYIQQFYYPKTDQIIMAIGFVVFCTSELEVMLNHEHTEYRWCSLEEAITLAPFPNQQQFYRHVWKHFVNAVPSPQLKIVL